MNPWFVLAAIPIVLVIQWWLGRWIVRTVAEYAATNLEVLHALRHTMEDLRTRDPQLDETLELALLEVDRLEKRTELLATIARFPRRR